MDVVETAMSDMSKAMVQRAVDEFRKKANGQVVLVLQGGGALGAYQAGVYQALHEAGVEPDWIVGTSIGAINASIIAGNKPEDNNLQLRKPVTKKRTRLNFLSTCTNRSVTKRIVIETKQTAGLRETAHARGRQTRRKKRPRRKT
jgi:predicted acylesterase/phospholipase RssA